MLSTVHGAYVGHMTQFPTSVTDHKVFFLLVLNNELFGFLFLFPPPDFVLHIKCSELAIIRNETSSREKSSYCLFFSSNSLASVR